MKRLLAWFVLMGGILGAAPGWALPTANSIITAQTPKRAIASLGLTAICTGSGVPYTCCTGNGAGCVPGTYYSLYSAGGNGSKCTGFTISNTDSSATHIITIDLNDGTDDHQVGSTTTVSPGSGAVNSASGAWTGLPNDSDGNPYLQIVSGDTLKVTFATGITSGKEIDIYASCADF